jgi:hypothetical protein
MGFKKRISRAEIAKRQKFAFLCCFWAFLGIYPLKKPYLGSLTVTKAGRNTRSATV